MKNKKNKIAFFILLIAVFALTALSVYLAQTLREAGRVSPAVPESVPSAAVPEACQLSFTVSPLTCYEGTCDSNSQCAEGLVCDNELALCVNPECRESEDCNCTTTTEITTSTTTTATATATPTPTATSTTTATATATATATPTATPSPASTSTTQSQAQYSCDSTCSTDAECQGVNANYICYSQTATCRHKEYPTQQNCQPPGGVAAVPSPTFPSDVPVSGINIPTVVGVGIGIILLLGALVFVI